MALDSILRGVTSGTGAEVDASNQLKVVFGSNPAAAGFTRIAGTAGQPMLLSSDGHVLVGQDQLTFYDQVDGVVVNTNLWLQAFGTMTITQVNGLINLNSTLLTTINTHANITSIKVVPLYGTLPVIVHLGAIVNTLPEANATMELGLGTVATTAAPTDGVFFRWNPAGEFVGVMNYGGVETITAPLTPPTINEAHNFQLVINNASVVFIIDSVVQATLARPAAQPFPVSNARLPVFARVYNGASVPAVAPRIQIGNAMVFQGVLEQNRPWSTTLAALGRGAYQSPVTTFTQTANHANSLAPVAGALANATASYATLGGKFLFNAVAGAVTDYALFGYQVPAGHQLYVTSVCIETMLTGAPIGTTATILDWAVGLNSSGVSLGTLDAAGTWAPRRIPLGMQGFPFTAPTGPAGIGDSAKDLERSFDPPLVVDAARFLHIIMSVPVGTATASQAFRGAVTIHGYFE